MDRAGALAEVPSLGLRAAGTVPSLGAGPVEGAGLELQHAERGWQASGTVGRPQSCWECPSTRHVWEQAPALGWPTVAIGITREEATEAALPLALL